MLRYDGAEKMRRDIPTFAGAQDQVRRFREGCLSYSLSIRNRPSQRKDQLISRVRECCSQPKLCAARLHRSRDQRKEDRRGRFA